jgi:hypothetical protein
MPGSGEWSWGCVSGDGRKVAQAMYTYVSKCKNDKIKRKKKSV